MKLFIDYILNDSGKGHFLKRLIPCLEVQGVRCKFSPKGCDVALGISKWKTKTSLPKVLRLDGIHLNGQNDKIAIAIKKADCVIFQSKFAKEFIGSHILVKPKRYAIIYNGASPDEYNRAQHRSGYLMAAHWKNRKHKRLPDHIKYAEKNPCDMFYIAGKVSANLPKNMVKLGDISNKILAQYQSRCIALVYLADIDWCPNVVVESRVAGMQIIYNPECKAVAELVGLPLDRLYINNVAAQYRKVFESVR